MAEKPKRLGRGLEALLGGAVAQIASPSSGEDSALRQVPIALIAPNPYQPRREFDEAELSQLEASLSSSGLLQPITVRRKGERFELVAGERRLRAATRLGWAEIPAIVKEFDDRALLTLALVENLQRADLNPIEEAEGFNRLIEEFDLTQQQIAEAVGKDRSTISNALRLLSLPVSVRRMVQAGELSVGHARALLALPSERQIAEVAREVVTKGLTVREVERRVRQSPGRSNSPTLTQEHSVPGRVAEIRRLTDLIRRKLQTDVKVDVGDNDRGELRVAFYSADDLNRIVEMIVGNTDEDA